MKNNQKSLIWVYPPNNWVSNYNKIFIYGWSDPKANLAVGAGFIEAGFVKAGFKPASTTTKIKIFSNGNFAQTVKLPHKKNIVRLVQILNGKKKIINRNVNVKSVGATFTVARRKWIGTKFKKDEHIGSPLHKTRHFVIVIDPGHGGKEHGTHSPKGIPEKYFNLQIAKILYKKLNVGADLRVCPKLKKGEHIGSPLLTRNTDKFVSLKDRVNFAKKKHANILISIHHNALPDNEDPLKHKGIGIYYTHDFVKPLARKLLDSISKSVGVRRGVPFLKKYGIFKRDFVLTRPNFCYAVLIECGFLIHPVEGEYVTRKDVQEKIVRGIIKGLQQLIS